jgi:hypothetical protein
MTAECFIGVATAVLAAGTLVLAAVAIFQDTVRGWFYHPTFQASIQTRPPDCIAVPFTKQDGTFIANSLYIRLLVENIGNATAKNAEVYANELLRRRADKTLERVDGFIPMNLKWSNLGDIYFRYIVPGMGKHCDVGHIVDPARRSILGEENPRLGLTVQQASLAFDLMVAPNHKGHIIAPGDYELKIFIAAENAHRIEKTISISLRGLWDADETTMLRDGVGVTIT